MESRMCPYSPAMVLRIYRGRTRFLTFLGAELTARV